MLEIVDLEAFAVWVPLRRQVTMSGEVVDRAQNLIVRVTDCHGRTGWGEAASALLMTGDTRKGMVAAARYMAKRLKGLHIGSADDPRECVSRAMYGNPGSKAAIEMALLDLFGQASGKPLHELIGGLVRKGAPVLQILSNDRSVPEHEQARRAVDRGVRAFKVKVGLAYDVRKDLARCQAVREAVGSGPRISADANEGFRRDDAIAFSCGAEAAGLDFVEQPVPADDLEGMRACAAVCAVPIGADEGIRNLADIREHHGSGAARGGSLKPQKLGIGNLMRAGRLMDELGMHVNIAGKVAETVIGSAAIAHWIGMRASPIGIWKTTSSPIPSVLSTAPSRRRTLRGWELTWSGRNWTGIVWLDRLSRHTAVLPKAQWLRHLAGHWGDWRRPGRMIPLPVPSKLRALPRSRHAGPPMLTGGWLDLLRQRQPGRNN